MKPYRDAREPVRDLERVYDILSGLGVPVTLRAVGNGNARITIDLYEETVTEETKPYAEPLGGIGFTVYTDPRTFDVCCTTDVYYRRHVRLTNPLRMVPSPDDDDTT